MRKTLLLLLTAVLVALVVVPALSGAAAPPSQDVAVPATGEATVTWTGTIPPGADPTSSCPAGGDSEELKFTVPDGLYDSTVVEATFSITWTPVVSSDTSDEILAVRGPDGASGTSDGSGTSETVLLNDPKAGTYTATACGFANAQPQDYQGKLTLRATSKAAAEPALPSAPAQGLSFTASVPADPQRDESEPNMEIDRDGNIYTCGPTGFSNASDYAQVSTDGGDQFHLLGEPPRGQQGSGGGGDCGLATGAARNGQNQFTYAYTGLGPLTGFTTSTSKDSGHTLATAGPQGNGNTAKGGLADRQWMAFLDASTVLLSYNQQQPRNIVVQKSTNGGLTYNDLDPDPDRQGVIAANSPNFPGPMRSMPASVVTPGAQGRVAYFGWNQSFTNDDGDNFELVNLALSDTTGLKWTNCLVQKLPTDDVVGLGAFTVADNDSEGNIYLTYNDQKRFHSYLTTLRHENLSKCTDKPKTDPITSLEDPTFPTTDPGWSEPVQVDRDKVRTTVFPWLAAGGEPGRVAVSFYGTESDGDPNTGAFKATWDVYVNQSLNALDANPAVSQVKATTHPFHYDSVCLLGLGCDLAQPPGDRSLADFFAIGYSATTKRLSLVYDQSSKIPDAAAGVIATPAVVTQNGGPANGGGTVDQIRPVLNVSIPDPKGDALANYSALNPVAEARSPNTQAEPAADIRSQTISRQRDPKTSALVANGGFDVTLQIADLSDAALAKVLSDSGSGSLLYTFRFVNGYQAGAASAFYSQAEGWSFGYNDYTVASAQCGSMNDKCQVFPGDKEIKGKVDTKAGTIVLSVPREYLRALTGPTGAGQRPTESKAVEGSRFYDATAYTLANPSPVARTQSFLYPLDNAPATDFLLPGAQMDAAGASQAETSNPGTVPAPPNSSAGPTACVASRLLPRAQAKPRGRGLRFAFKRRRGARVTVDVFQSSHGRRVVGPRLVARFKNRKRSFTWNGKANRKGRNVSGGYYFVRFTATRRSTGARDIRRKALRRRGGRFRSRRAFHRHENCSLLRLYKLRRPVFGGKTRRGRKLGIAFRIRQRARVKIVVKRRGKRVKRFKARTVRPDRVKRLKLRPRGLRRGDYTVRLIIKRPGGKRKVTRLVSHKL